MFDAHKYLQDHRIRFATSGKDVGPGWLAVKCPFCKDPENHGGFSPEGYYTCWRCGGHRLEDVVMALSRVEWHEACAILMEYESDYVQPTFKMEKAKAQGLQGKLDWPPGAMLLQTPHKAYLARRGFDPNHLEAKYKLKATGPAGPYAWRIIVPIFLNGQMVSYQGRDVTNKADLRYKACKKEVELVDHKKLLYNADNAGETGIIVEGVFDVWRLGDGAVAAIGTSVTKEQVIMAAEKFRKAFILFDAEKPAQAKARKLANALSTLGTEAVVVKLDKGDPADLDQESANKLKEELLK